MKKILSFAASFAVVATAVGSTLTASAASMPITKADTDSMITSLRNSPYIPNFDICTRDVSVIKASYRELYDVNMALLRNWITETSKTRALTVAERKELLAVQDALQLEARFPKRASWQVCDEIASQIDHATWDWVENFDGKAKTVSDEYKKAVFTNVKDGLSSFDSKSLGGKVAVVRSSRISLFTNDYPNYKGVIVEVSDARGVVTSQFVFLPQNDINTKNATYNGFKLKNVTTDMLAKIYMSIAPGVPNRPAAIAPVKKVGNLYYSYKQYK